MLTPFFYIFLDADITPEDPQMGQGGLQDAPGACYLVSPFYEYICCSLISFAETETLRCLALALKRMPMGQQTLSFNDEQDLTFIGLVCFLF
ncbi:hypothetical protein CK203_012721 [Vitis vinifera]|uniref:Uncharacterized protein n=1 Tax=Vitis vinifera TaxID=29760 RepID=A0A438KN25_VITVI|nr:hypothetical protein CK203_012721 [Vitis vinifera]